MAKTKAEEKAEAVKEKKAEMRKLRPVKDYPNAATSTDDFVKQDDLDDEDHEEVDLDAEQTRQANETPAQRAARLKKEKELAKKDEK